MKILFCIPGNAFTPRFLANWTTLITELTEKGIPYYLSTGYTPVVHIAREKVLDALNEKIEYTHVMWIDSDIDFTPNDFFKLLSYNKPVVSGLYRLVSYPERFSAMINKEFVSRNFIANNINCCSPSIIEADWVGLGWMLTQAEVYKKLKFPYFDSSNTKMEDELFCDKLRKNGYKINVDLTTVVGHEKIQVLR
jgi:hypothetical protein|tara:strand:- start:2017 stop:2598 length:582 start_codon:yes stop_codon:yes gene_type:complete